MSCTGLRPVVAVVCNNIYLNMIGLTIFYIDLSEL